LDTLSKYDMFINVRNDGTYLYSNLFFNCRIAVSKRRYANADTLGNMKMSKTGFGRNGWERVWQFKGNKLWYKRKRFVFPTSGYIPYEISQPCVKMA